MLFGKRVVALCISRIHDLENCRFVMELNEKRGLQTAGWE